MILAQCLAFGPVLALAIALIGLLVLDYLGDGEERARQRREAERREWREARRIKRREAQRRAVPYMGPLYNRHGREVSARS